MKVKKILTCGITIFVIGMGVFTVHAMNNNENTTKSINFIDSKVVTAEYSSSKYSNDNKELKVYLDNSKNEYIYSNDSLVGYLKNVELTADNDDSKTIKDTSSTIDLLKVYETKANNIFNQIIDMNSTKRSVETAEYDMNYSHYREDYKEYVYTYTKKIGKYDTNDSITIALDKDGNLSSFNATRQGMFDEYDNIVIEDKKVVEFIESSMEDYLEGTTDSYKVNYTLINIKDNKLVLEIGIGIVLDDYEDSYKTTILYYEI